MSKEKTTILVSSSAPEDLAIEQSSIVIGQRRRGRGTMLSEERIRRDERAKMLRELQARELAARQEPQRAVTISERCSQTGIAIGDCGCNTCNGGGAGKVMFSSAPSTSVQFFPSGNQGPLNYAPNPTGNGTSVPLPNGNGHGYGADDMDPWWTGCLPTPGCYPLNACSAKREFKLVTYWDIIRKETRCRRAPYTDMAMDWVDMDYIVSPITTIGAGLTVPVNVQPSNGTFAVFYWDIVVVDPTTQVSQVDWRVDHPRVEGCPVPCAQPVGPMLSQFVQKVPEACCGNPLVAWLDRASENLPLTVSVTNNQAAGDLLAQVRVRGYCCSTRIC